MADPNSRPPLVVAVEWATKIVTFALEMALPGLAGWWIDGRVGTSPWLLIAGSVLGFVVGFYHLMQAVSPPRREDQ